MPPRPPRPRLSFSIFGFLKGEAEGGLAVAVLAVLAVVALLLRFPPWH